MRHAHIEGQGPARLVSYFVGRARAGRLSLNRNLRRTNMREWHKPTVEETESGMEVTSYLPAELDRA